MTFLPEPLDPIAVPVIPQSYLSTLIPSAPMNNLAAVLGEPRLSIYLLTPIFLSSAAAQSNETFFSEERKKVSYKTVRKKCSWCRGKAMQHSRSNNADAAFPLRISQTLHSPSSLVERGQTGTEVGWITTVCKHQRTEIQSKAPSLKGCIYKTRLRKDYSPAGISASRPEISLRASAHREVESAIILTW